MAEQAAEEREKQALKATYANIYRRQSLRRLPVEPGTNEANTVRLSFRTAAGGRLIRQFRGSETLEDVYIFIDTFGMEQQAGSSSSLEMELPEDYVHEYEFTLASLMPRKVFPFETTDEPLALSEIQELWPSANLVVESKELDEED